jgi:hypothetical protein
VGRALKPGLYASSVRSRSASGWVSMRSPTPGTVAMIHGSPRRTGRSPNLFGQGDDDARRHTFARQADDTTSEFVTDRSHGASGCREPLVAVAPGHLGGGLRVNAIARTRAVGAAPLRERGYLVCGPYGEGPKGSLRRAER